MRRWLVSSWRRWHATAVEGVMHPVGFPDISYADGLAELKYLRKAPRDPERPLLIDHFTPQQRLFLRRRWLADGSAWLILEVHRDAVLLFDGVTAAEIVGKASYTGLKSEARLALPWGRTPEVAQALMMEMQCR